MLKSTVPRNTYIGTGTTGTFGWNWLIDEASDLHVAVLVPQTGVPSYILVVLTQGVDYVIQTPATQVGSDAGGNIVLTNTGYFAPSNGLLPSGYAIVIRRSVAFAQPDVFPNQGAYDPGEVESALDYLDMQIQQLQDQLGRTLQTPLDDYTAPGQNIGLAPVRALQFVCFDATGNVTTALAVSEFSPTDIGPLGTPKVGLADLGNTAACYLNDLINLTSSDGITYTWTAPFSIYAGMLATCIWPYTSASVEPVIVTNFSFLINPDPITNPIKQKSGAPLYGGQLQAGTAYLLLYDGSAWRVMV
jgi:hypothetical protein